MGIDMNILFTICGRAGSKGIKNKNLREFLNYPLPFYTMSAIDLYIRKHPEMHSDVVLNTDSEDLIRIFKDQLSIQNEIIKRDISLGLDDTPKGSVILNCLDKMEERKSIIYDIVVDLDITSPLRTIEDIENLIDKKLSCEADVVFSVTDSRRNPYFNMVKKTEKGYKRVICSNFNARQEAPEIFDMNASIYAYTPSFLKSGKGIFEGHCEIIKMMDTGVLDLDCENDFELMQVVAKYLYKNYPKFNDISLNIRQIMHTNQEKGVN